MTRSRYPTLQEHIPTFVRIPKGITWNSHFYGPDVEFPWLSLGIDPAKARIMFDAGQLYHSEELEHEFKVGDGLDPMTIQELNFLVDTLNAKVKKATSSDAQYNQKKCKKSLVKSKQIGLIRSWRRNFGHFE